MAESNSKKLSFVLYEENNPPRYYHINKAFLRFVIYGLPSAALICIVLLATGGVYFEQIQRLAQRKEPAIIKKLKDEKDQLIKANLVIQKERDQLEKKLSEGVDTSSGLGFLALFKQSSGRVDKSTSPEMQLEEIEVVKGTNKVNLDFKIINMTKDDSRLTGYLFVIMQIGNQIEVWPKGVVENESMQIAYGNGEFFATSRFRPVRAAFNLKEGNQVLFKVVIFSRTGDLIFKQLISKPL
ncbi:MAG: hypothetical protein VXV96_06220 [Bdellovibrionota bacterium]|nr:hypothetical protein [Bdellovibrionota bacterium]